MANTKKYISLDKLGLYDEKIKKVISDGDGATLDAAKSYAESLASNYDAAGLAATAESNAKAYTDTEVAKANGAAATAQAAAEAAAAAASTADGKAVAAQTTADEAVAAIGELADYVGDIPTDEAYANIETVIGYVNKKAEETLAAAQGGSQETAASVKAQLDTYKTENNARVNKNIEDIAALQTALDEEIARAEGKEGENAAAIADIVKDYLKAADKTELQGNIDTLTGVVETLRDGIDATKVDGVIDLIDYVDKHGAVVTGLQEGIAQNATDIAGVAGRMTTAEGKITTLEGAVATKVEQEAYDAKIAELAGADTGLGNRIKTLEDKFGGAEGSVEDMIADAQAQATADAIADAAAKDAALKAEIETAYKKYADDEDALIEARVEVLEGASATHALASDLTALDGRVTTAEGKIGTLESEMDAVEAKAAANETAIGTINTELAKKALDADLTTAKDRITALETWHSNFLEVSEEEINNLFA